MRGQFIRKTAKNPGESWSSMKTTCMLLAALWCQPVLVSADSAVAEPSEYRMDDYDAPVPDALTGAGWVGAVEVQRLMVEENAVVVDVIPEHRKPEALPENQIWIPVPHEGVPGALWLPDTGFGPLSETTERYFRMHLEEATEGDLDRPVAFYCRADCWMSWNAAKRALSYGYKNVYWFAEGVDDWFFEGFDFAHLTPAMGQRQ